jgi:hypothetical protein
MERREGVMTVGRDGVSTVNCPSAKSVGLELVIMETGDVLVDSAAKDFAVTVTDPPVAKIAVETGANTVKKNMRATTASKRVSVSTATSA